MNYSEKEKLFEFVKFILSELASDKLLSENDRERWLKSPIAGVRQAANDMVEATNHIPEQKLLEIDGKLNAMGLPTITNMRDRNYQKLLKILTRNIIKNEEEWRIVRSQADNVFLSPQELQQTRELLDESEFKST